MPDCRKIRWWEIEIATALPYDTLVCRGTGIRIQEENGTKEVYVSLPFSEHLLASIKNGAVCIYAFAGNVVPCFARIRNRKLKLSNIAARLINKGETLGISTFAAIQQMLGQPYPFDNIFHDFQQLEASSVYRLKGNDLVYDSTAVRPRGIAHLEEALSVIDSQFEDVARSGRPLCILLSGGYDSRLNLAFAVNYARKFGNRVVTFHEVKDQAEADIARRVAAEAKVPLTEKTRMNFVGKERPVAIDRDFILFQSGTYRDNLLRWHHYLDWIKQQVPDGLIIGLGAEAHKGKWYRSVHRLPRDAEITFGIPAMLIEQLSRKLHIKRIDPLAQQRLFTELTRQCAEFEQHAAKVDYIHYITYVSFGYGRRGHDLQQLYGIPFPFLNNDFLRLVFSLEPKDKEGFKLVETAIKELAPSLATVPFTSANKKSLASKHYGLKDDILLWLADVSRPVRDQLLKTRGKGRTVVHAAEADLIEKNPPASEVTKTLDDAIRGKYSFLPRIRLDYAMQLFLYLSTLEREYGVSFEWR